MYHQVGTCIGIGIGIAIGMNTCQGRRWVWYVAKNNWSLWENWHATEKSEAIAHAT
jgi:hypothetical protein